MPFKSKAQRAYLYAKHPSIAKRFAAETEKGAKLPDHAVMHKAAVDRLTKGGKR